MAVNFINDDSTLIASKMMGLAMERQQVISNNMANASVPGYIRKDLDFQKKLAEVVQSGDLSKLSDVKPELVEDNTDAPKLDGNNVEISKEMTQMMQNGVLFNLLSRAYSTKMNIIRSSMKGA